MKKSILLFISITALVACKKESVSVHTARLEAIGTGARGFINGSEVNLNTDISVTEGDYIMIQATGTSLYPATVTTKVDGSIIEERSSEATISTTKRVGH